MHPAILRLRICVTHMNFNLFMWISFFVAWQYKIVEFRSTVWEKVIVVSFILIQCGGFIYTFFNVFATNEFLGESAQLTDEMRTPNAMYLMN